MAKEHFDERASTWDDDPDKIRTAQAVAQAAVASTSTQAGARLLEYGAGTGLVTQALHALVGELSVTVADNSAGMRRVLADKVASGALPAQARVWDLDLEHQPPPPEPFELHHVHDLEAVLAAFAALLDEEGHVCIADLDREDGTFHTHDFDGHHGFDRRELTAALEQAGFVEVTFTDCTQIDKEGTAHGVFLATARRARADTPRGRG